MRSWLDITLEDLDQSDFNRGKYRDKDDDDDDDTGTPTPGSLKGFFSYICNFVCRVMPA